jgi:hypothetical protein
MANPPPPYDNITGISRAVMKDNAQETLANYDGNARPGELVVDLTQDPPPLYVGNNSGQLTLVASGGGGYGNTQVAQFLAAGLVGNIIPAGNGVNSLGNSTNYWANLWVANNTIYLGGVPLGMAAGNVLTVNGNAVLQNNSNSTISTTGNITSGNVLTGGIVSATGNVTGNYFIGNGSQLTGLSTSSISNGTSNVAIPIANGNVTIAANASSTWTFGTDSTLTLPAGSSRITSYGQITIETDNNASGMYLNADSVNLLYANANVTLRANSTGTNKDWNFGNTGNLTLPLGGVVSEGAAPTGIGNTIAITPSGGSDANQQLLVYPTGNIVEGNHLHLTTGDLYNTELFLGNDNLYVRLANTGNVVINSYDDTGNTAQWTFGTNGNLTLPGNIIAINYADGNRVTGGITFDGEAVIGTGTSNTQSGLYLAPDPVSLANSLYLRVRGNILDEPTHIHFDTGNNQYFNQFIGDDNKYIQLANAGNIVINTNNYAGNTAQWNFDYNGVLTLPNGATLNDTSGDSVAFGQNAGNSAQGDNAVAIGVNAGSTTQGQFAVAIGDNAGNNAQGTDAVAIGASAGLTTQGNRAVAIGISAGQTSQGINSIAIGQGAGEINQGNNSIILNATGVALDQTTANTFTVAPVRNDVANIAEVMFYNTTSKEVTYGNVISVAGNITGAYLFGNGSQLTGITASVPSQTILPTIQTITVEARPAGLFGGGQGGANVTVANTIPVTEYGVIITNGTSNEKYATGSLASIPGTVSLTFNTGLNSAQFTVFAYVTSNAGTFYSNSATGTSGICLLAGTQIALGDGTHKAIEHITYTDKMLSWDFDRGCYAETTAMWIKRSETGSQYNLLTFSDGTTLRTFDQHRIFNKQAGAFTYPMTDATPVGTITVNEHGQEITLINKQVIVDTIEYYNVITDHHMNLFSNSILTSCRFNNIYPIQDMKFVKDSRPLRSRSEFHQIDDRFFHGLRLAEQQFDLAMIEWYVSRLESLEINTDLAVAV